MCHSSIVLRRKKRRGHIKTWLTSRASTLAEAGHRGVTLKKDPEETNTYATGSQSSNLFTYQTDWGSSQWKKERFQGKWVQASNFIVNEIELSNYYPTLQMPSTLQSILAYPTQPTVHHLFSTKLQTHKLGGGGVGGGQNKTSGGQKQNSKWMIMLFHVCWMCK